MTPRPRSFTPLLTVGAALIAMSALLGAGGCAGTPQRTFNSPEAAAEGIVSALRADDQASLKEILGPGSDDLVSSGDPVADQHRRGKFIEKYEQKHALVPGEDGIVTLQVGADDWPLPLPIVRDEATGKWRFDTDAGRDEIVARRVGQNELDVIEVCKAIVEAQREYAKADRNGDGTPEYAGKFFSDPGQRNGLYWESRDGEPTSPLGPLVAEAADQGYSANPTPSAGPRPYHGYMYRMLTSQSANAPGGASDYMVGGKMTGGFAVVAYPAEYGNSGITTFLVSHHGVIYEKDLGPQSSRLAGAMKAFDPGAGWDPIGLAAPEPVSTR